MNSVLPEDLHPNRVFFTEFDRVTYSQVAWTDDDVKKIYERLNEKIKLLTITKGNIVIAASHLLESEIARDFVFANPKLIEKGIIVPSLRSEFYTCKEFLQRKREDSDIGEAEPYKCEEALKMAEIIDNAPVVVRWKLEDASDWFKLRMLKDLEDERSILRLSLKNESIKKIYSIKESIENEVHLSRGAIYRIGKNSKNKNIWHNLSDYGDFIYYLGGARTVKSEGVLPQENLLDYSLGDLAGWNTRLSDYEIFFKIFIDIVKAKTCTIFPSEVLSSFSINDVIDLHEIAIKEDFTDKYNMVQTLTKDAISIKDPEKLVLLLEEIESFESELYNNFEEEIKSEIISRQRESKKYLAREMLQSIASLVIPYEGHIDTAKTIIINGLKLADRKDISDKIEIKIEKGFNAIEKVMEKVNISEKQILLDFVNNMKKKYVNKMNIY